MMCETIAALMDRFERLDIKPQDFGHFDHVKVAYGMLGRYDFMDASHRYALTIKAMADRAGAPEKFNATITFAFMSLIAERISNMDSSNRDKEGFDAFLSSNPDLLKTNALSAWYSHERLTSAKARTQFLLPDRPLG